MSRSTETGARPTPQTDAAEVYYSEIVSGRDAGLYWVRAEFARQLERSLRDFCTAFENEGKTSSLKEWNDRLKTAYKNAGEALAGREPYAEPK
jgi:hypothetical protein